ncbi:DUF6893 family small protein [Kitasatospora sp. NPDC054939]
MSKHPLGTAVLVATTVVAGLALLRGVLPDLRRYLRISRM